MAEAATSVEVRDVKTVSKMKFSNFEFYAFCPPYGPLHCDYARKCSVVPLSFLLLYLIFCRFK